MMDPTCIYDSLFRPHPSNATHPAEIRPKTEGCFGIMVGNNPLIRAYFPGATLRFPWYMASKSWWCFFFNLHTPLKCCETIPPFFCYPKKEKKLPSQVAPQFPPKKSKTNEEISQVEILDESIGTGVPSFCLERSGGVE